MHIKRLYPEPLRLMLRSLAIGVLCLSGCKSLDLSTDCVEWEQKVVYQRVCSNSNDQGTCTNSRSEPQYRDICVKRAAEMVRAN